MTPRRPGHPPSRGPHGFTGPTSPPVGHPPLQGGPSPQPVNRYPPSRTPIQHPSGQLIQPPAPIPTAMTRRQLTKLMNRDPAVRAMRRRRRLRNFGGLLLALGVALLVWVWLGLALLPVKSGSMVPSFYPADVLVAVSPRVIPPTVGDVVVAEPYFTAGGERLPPIAHRIVDIKADGWVTKGDANPEADGWTVRDEDITHVMVTSLPMRHVTNPLWFAVVLGLLVLYALWPKKEKNTVASAVSRPAFVPNSQSAPQHRASTRIPPPPPGHVSPRRRSQ
jgi:signal peptidase I